MFISVGTQIFVSCASTVKHNQICFRYHYRDISITIGLLWELVQVFAYRIQERPGSALYKQESQKSPWQSSSCQKTEVERSEV